MRLTLEDVETLSNINALIWTNGDIEQMSPGQKKALSDAGFLDKSTSGGRDQTGFHYEYNAVGKEKLKLLNIPIPKPGYSARA